MTDYQTRYKAAREMLAGLDYAALADELGVDLIDQMRAAGRETYTTLQRMAQLLSAVKPEQFKSSNSREITDRDAIDDMTARLIATMSDGGWRFCPHLRRNPAQPARVQLPLRRVACQRCASTHRMPPPDEDDRCDLCGSRGNTVFWPIVFTHTNWLVLGDMCRSCAEATGVTESKP